MVNRNNLEDSATVGVTATILVISSLISIFMIRLHLQNYRYPKAQQHLFFLFLVPSLVGWGEWIEILIEESPLLLTYLMSFIKEYALIAFLLYIEALLGWENTGDKNYFSKEAELKELCRAENTFRFLRCFKMNPFKTRDEAKSYLTSIRILVYQAMVVIITLGIIGIIVIIAGGVEEVEDGVYTGVISLLSGGKAVCSVIAIIALIHFCLFTNSLPGMKKYQFFHKFIVVKAAILFADVQPLVIHIFAATGLIADTSEFSSDEITNYTNAVLVCTEVLAISILIVFLFPVKDYIARDEEKEGLVEDDNKAE